MRGRTSGVVVVASLVVATGWLGSCGPNPFTRHEDDYARRVALERLRSIRETPLEGQRAPARDAADEQGRAAEIRERFAGREQMELGIEECRASTIEHNLDLKVALIDPTIARERVSEEDARFESAFTLRTTWNELDSPTASTLASAQSRTRTFVPGVRIPTRTGGTVSVDLPVTRNENDNAFSTLNPAYTSDLQFSVSHPLLRNAGRRANTAQLRILGYETQVSEARTKLEVIRQLAASDRAYWRLYQARRELEVSQQQFELAQEQLGRAERRVRAGALADIEVVRAQAGVADRLEAIIVAQNTVLLRQRELKRIINRPGLELESPTLVVPATPPDPVEYLLDRPVLVGAALDNRMEMLELELQLAADAVRIDFARNQALPLVTLDYTYRINGLGGSTQDTFRTLGDNDFEDWEIGLAAEIPLGNEGAKSRIRQAILSRLSRLGTREARERAIREEVLNAADSIDAGWQRILASRQSVILNTRALQSEQRQFDVGSSTSTDVLDAAARLADAQLSEVRALADYQIAQIDLAFASGTMLGASKVTWEFAPPPEVSRWGTEAEHAPPPQDGEE
ncbi:MAG: TolC family protein [Planctomycetota bacterium]|nr:TolC family protein [Planctomycetota bacterium]